MKTKYKYISSFGQILKLTSAQYMKYLKAGESGDNKTMNAILSKAKVVADNPLNVTDMNPEDFSFRLQYEENK